MTKYLFSLFGTENVPLILFLLVFWALSDIITVRELRDKETIAKGKLQSIEEERERQRDRTVAW